MRLSQFLTPGARTVIASGIKNPSSLDGGNALTRWHNSVKVLAFICSVNLLSSFLSNDSDNNLRNYIN